MRKDICTNDPNHVPDDPTAAALDLLTQLPVIAGAEAGSEMVACFQDIAGSMQLEGILGGLDWHDARHTVAALGQDLMFEGEDKLLRRVEWIRSTAQSVSPLHEPELVAVAIERVYALMVQPIAGPMPARGQL